MKYILKVDRLTKYFIPPISLNKLLTFDFKDRKPFYALEDISFSLERGKIFCVLGLNGAGKTTLLKIISTIIFPNKGTISIFPQIGSLSEENSYGSITWPHKGVKSSGIEEKIKALIGLVAEEERSFYWRLSARENLEFFATLHGLDKKTSKTKIETLFKLFEISSPDKRFDSYSTGIKRRIALIRGLLHNPELLLLDEPTKSLDYETSLNLKIFIKENLVRAQRKTVLFTTHNMDEATDFADTFMILHQGKFLALGTLDELRIKIGRPLATLGEIFLKLTREPSKI